MDEHAPHPANVPGDFFVEDGCCTMCEVPLTEAPDLFGVFGAGNGCSHCYVKRQPQSSSELDRMIETINRAEFDCIRYQGSDRIIQARLAASGSGDACDDLPPEFQHIAGGHKAEREWRNVGESLRTARSYVRQTGSLELRIHPTFGRRLFATIMNLFAVAMSCLGLSFWGESRNLPALTVAGLYGFVACCAGFFIATWWHGKHCRCPGCGQWLTAEPDRDTEKSLRFACFICGVEWDTQGIIDC